MVVSAKVEDDPESPGYILAHFAWKIAATDNWKDV
jgi:hypothetical protein